MNLQDEFDRIDEITAKAIAFIESGKSKQGLREITKFENSWARSEAMRAKTIVTAYCWLYRRKPRKAQDVCKKNLAYVWNNADGLFFLRAPNKPIDEKALLFDVCIKGGDASFGLTAFTEDYFVNFHVAASNEFEALTFIDSLGCFSEPDSKIVQSIIPIDPREYELDRCGIYFCSPFRLEENI